MLCYYCFGLLFCTGLQFIFSKSSKMTGHYWYQPDHFCYLYLMQWNAEIKKTLRPVSVSINRDQLPKGYRPTTRRLFFLPLSSQKFLLFIWSNLQRWKAESTLSHPVVLNTGSVDWKNSRLTTRPL